MRTVFRLIGIVLVASTLATCRNRSGTTSTRGFPTATESDLQGQLRTNLDSPNPTPQQLARRTQNTDWIKKQGLPVMETLPVVEADATVTPRTPKEIRDRCIATFIAAVHGDQADPKLTAKLTRRFNASGLFSPNEKAFVGRPATDAQKRADFAWRYECMHVFLWALGRTPKLAGPSERCPADREIHLLTKLGRDGLLTGAHPRTRAELLDAADLYYRLHWAAIELRLNGKPSPKLDEEVVQERHRAVNWLIRYEGQDWDDVTTDT